MIGLGHKNIVADAVAGKTKVKYCGNLREIFLYFSEALQVEGHRFTIPVVVNNQTLSPLKVVDQFVIKSVFYPLFVMPGTAGDTQAVVRIKENQVTIF